MGSCCEPFGLYSELRCDEHVRDHDCPDVLIVDRYGGWGIPVRDGGSSWVTIMFCPWCGGRLTPPGTISGLLSRRLLDDQRTEE